MLHRADSRPALGDGHEALLHQVLGLGEVPNDEVRRPQQRVGRAGNELLELRPPLVVALGTGRKSVHMDINPSDPPKG